MKGNKSALKSVLVTILSLTLVVSLLLPMTAYADTTGNYYTVKSGDSLSSIAASYGVSVANIIKLNNISSAATIYPGQVLLMPEGSVGSATNYSSNNYGSISVNFKDVDLASALSAITKYTDYTILYTGNPQEVTFKISDVSPLSAVDYVLRIVGMSYIKNGNTLIVGETGTLNSKFIDKATLAKFSLRYISTEVLKEQLGKLGVSVQFVETGDTNGRFWVNAYPMELATIRELISLLDNNTNLSLGSANIASGLSFIEMKYMSADSFSSLLSQLGLHKGLTISEFPMRLFVYATGDAYKDIMKIKNMVDVPEAAENSGKDNPADGTASGSNATGNVDGTNSSNTGTTNGTGENPGTTEDTEVLQKFSFTYLERKDVEQIVSELQLGVSVYGTDLLAKTVWLSGTQKQIDDATVVLSSFDIESSKASSKIFTYELKNITSGELEAKMSSLQLEGALPATVVMDYGENSSISHTVTIKCSEDFRATIIDIIEKLDSTNTNIYKTLKVAASDTEVESLKLEIKLVCELTGINESSFYFSGDLDSSENVKYVLYAYESPENIKLIKTMFAEIENPS